MRICYIVPQERTRPFENFHYTSRTVLHINGFLSENIYYWQTRRLAQTRIAIMYHCVRIDMLSSHFVHATAAVGRVRENIKLAPTANPSLESAIYRHRVVQELVRKLESDALVIARENFVLSGCTSIVRDIASAPDAKNVVFSADMGLRESKKFCSR